MKSELATAWKMILQHYTDAYAEIPPLNDKARKFCETAFLGVVLLIMDEDIKRHQVLMPHRMGNDLCFALPKFAPQLLTVAGEQMPDIAKLYAFSAESKTYALKFAGNQPELVPVQPEATANNPIFAVYAMEHSNGLSQSNEILPWVEPFQNFLCVESAEQPGLLNSLLPRLIMLQWQFQRIDIAAKFQRQTLHQSNTLYRNKSDQYLICTPNRELEQQLREIEQLRTEADYLSGRLLQAMRTLKITQTNLKHHLEATQYQSRWQVNWQPPLLEGFSQAINKLDNHQTYLQGEVTYLIAHRIAGSLI